MKNFLLVPFLVTIGIFSILGSFGDPSPLCSEGKICCVAEQHIEKNITTRVCSPPGSSNCSDVTEPKPFFNSLVFQQCISEEENSDRKCKSILEEENIYKIYGSESNEEVKHQLHKNQKFGRNYTSCQPSSNIIPDEKVFAFKKHLKNISNDNYKIYYASENPNDPFQCRKHCKDNDPFCEKIDLKSTLKTRIDEIKNLKNLLISGKKEIEKSEILEIFEGAYDTCERGNVYLSDGALVNQGKGGCITKIKLPSNERISLFLPKKIQANYSFNDGLNLNINNIENPIVIKHNRENSILNGLLSYIHMSDNELIVRVDNLCLSSEI